MSFWNGLKSAFGFGTGDDEEEYDSDIPTYAPKPIQLEQQSSHSAPVHQEPQTSAETSRVTDNDNESADSHSTPTVESETQDATATNGEADEPKKVDDPLLPADLLDAVIERFNAFQPDFVAQCLNVEAERKYLLQSISDNLKARVAKVVAESMPKDAAVELKRLQTRVATLEGQKKTNEELRQENRRLRLSVERQKRSLLDRINDLEAQVAQHFQEKEKFFASRHYSKCSLATQTNAPAEGEENSGETLESLKEQLQASRSEIETLKNLAATAEEREKELSANLETKEQELNRETTLRQQLETKTAMSDTMINTLRNDLAANRKEYEETINEQQKALESINEQIISFEQIKERMETRIADLKKQKADLDNRVSTLTDENSSLRHTIENNLYNQANSELKLRNEIKSLESRLKEAEEKAAATASSESETKTSEQPDISEASFSAVIEASRDDDQPKRRKRGRPKKVKIDDELDNTDWFTSQKDNPDFGYHEPPRRPVNDDANQLTLF